VPLGRDQALFLEPGERLAHRNAADIASGVLRCAVVLDFPPMGSRDADNNPIGLDDDSC
jgi:polar amino acid transport system substrate-binding protein